MNYSYAANLDPAMAPIVLILCIALLIAVPCIMGTLTKKLAAKKGYTGYFWTGFFLSTIGLLYVGFLPINNQQH